VHRARHFERQGFLGEAGLRLGSVLGAELLNRRLVEIGINLEVVGNALVIGVDPKLVELGRRGLSAV